MKQFKRYIAPLILLSLLFSSCARHVEEPEWCEVIQFEQTAVADAYISAGRESYRGKAYLYTMLLIGSKKQVIEKKVISNEVYRFFPGDSIKVQHGRIIFKKL